MRAAAWMPLLLLALAGCGGSDREGAPDRAPNPPTTVATVPSGRHLTDAERAAMLAALGAEQGSVRKVWFALAPGDPEAAALKDALEGVFKQAGWETATQTVTGMVLKPGLSILIAAEEPPPYVATAQRALEATAFQWKTGRGYRPYFEERKRADPKWPGIELAPDQDFVVVVGPMAPAP
jgi:hypothetical protein